MFRPASRALLRGPTTTAAAGVAVRGPASRRLVSTAPSEPSKSRSWKSTTLRFGLAIGAVYYYNTSDVFSNQPTLTLRPRDPTNYQPEDDKSAPTLDSIKPRIREEREREAAQYGHGRAQSAQELEEEADQEAAFNPETGEINWDCPCLGGMAHGPCGEAFKAAFSCFVYSKEEPKGIDCIEKFKGMQDCFRAHPDVYGSELEDDEPPQQPEEAGNPTAPSSGEVATAAQIEAASHPDEKRSRAKEVKAQVSSAAARDGEQAESDELIPKAWHDTDQKNADTKPPKTAK